MKAGASLIALTIAAMLSASSSAVAQTPIRDAVGGEARDCTLPLCAEDTPGYGIPLNSIGLDVTSGPIGENATGDVHFHYQSTSRYGESTNGDATCLSVNGNVAVVGFQGFWADTVFGPIAWVTGLIRIVDGGLSSGQDTWQIALTDTADPEGPPLTGPSECSGFPAQLIAPFVNDGGGDLLVRDGQPLPVSKQDCKDGGWRTYGSTFENQGQCVAFVQRGPKP